VTPAGSSNSAPLGRVVDKARELTLHLEPRLQNCCSWTHLRDGDQTTEGLLSLALSGRKEILFRHGGSCRCDLIHDGR
jgi:hypothetical protein